MWTYFADENQEQIADRPVDAIRPMRLQPFYGFGSVEVSFERKFIATRPVGWWNITDEPGVVDYLHFHLFEWIWTEFFDFETLHLKWKPWTRDVNKSNKRKAEEIKTEIQVDGWEVGEKLEIENSD